MAYAAQSPYAVMRGEFTRLIKSKIETGDYPDLKNPNNKTRPSSSLRDRLYRFTILPREPRENDGSRRVLEASDAEVIAIVHGLPISENPLEGFRLVPPRFRFYFGIENPNYDIADLTSRELAPRADELAEQSIRGEFDQFVGSLMDIVEHQIRASKDNLR